MECERRRRLDEHPPLAALAAGTCAAQFARNSGTAFKAPGRRPDPQRVDAFALTLVLAVPALYGLFWWLDYRWLSHSREQELPTAPSLDDDDDAF